MKVSIRKNRSEFYSIWKKCTSEGSTEGLPHYLPNSILRSWQRSLEAGVDHTLPKSPFEPKQSDLVQVKIKRSEPLCDIFSAHVKDLLSNQIPLVFYFADSDGCVLKLYGHDNLLKIFEDIDSKVGSFCTENLVGTTAPGLSLVEKRPCIVLWEEHFLEICHQFGCLGVPVFGQNDDLLGVLNLTTDAKHAHTLKSFLPFVLSVANSIRLEMTIRENLIRNEIFESYFHSNFEYGDSNLIMIDPKGSVLDLNKRSQELFNVHLESVRNKDVRIILGKDLPDNFLTNTLIKGMGTERCISLGPASSGTLSAKIMPILNHSGTEIAFVLKIDVEKLCAATSCCSSGNKTQYTFADIIGNSPSWVDLINRAKRISPISSNVLIEGESGTGKELIAHSIHRNSQFAHGPFVAINCGAIPETLLESELFGYEKGAFTGAKKEGHKGKFELANGGTLFLDEIYHMNKTAQAKLLRVLEGRHLDRLGGRETIPINMRVISASSVNLLDQMKRGYFLEALFFRINVVRLSVPALRDRREDIPLLVDHFISLMNKRFSRAIRGVEPAVLQAFSQYSWPGNVRQLKNVIECAVALCDGELITVKDVNDHLFPEDENEKNQAMNIHNLTKNLITDALKQTKSIKKASEKLDIPLSTLYKKMKKLNIRIPSF